MAVIVSDSRNASYTGKISTANGFYRAEAYNMTCESGTTLSLSTTRTIAVTFLNAGNCQGITLALQNYSMWYFNRSITIDLQENVASVWTTRTSITKTLAQVIDAYGVQYDNTYAPFFAGYIPFKFATPYAVDTTASKWRFQISQSASPYNSYLLRTSDGTNPSFVAWCDNQVTYSDTNDAIVCVDKTYIDTNFNPKAYSGTGDTTFGVTTILCTNPDYTDPHKLIVRDADLAGPITWTMDGITYWGSGSGVQIGSTASPITYAKRFSIVYKRISTIGGTNDNIYWKNGLKFLGNKTSLTACENASLQIAGEIPVLAATTLSVNADTLQANITVTDSPASWTVGNRLVIGRSNTKGRTTEALKFYTISSIAGNVITLTGNITEKRWIGGQVINLDAKYGVRIYSDDITKGSVNHLWLQPNAPYIFSMVGVIQEGVGIQTMALGTRVISSTYSTTLKVTDCTFCQDITNSLDNNNRFGFQGVMPNVYGFEFTRVHVFNVTCFTGSSGTPTLTRVLSTSSSSYPRFGRITVQDCSQLLAGFQNFSGNVSLEISFLNNNFSNFQYCPFYIYGNNFIGNNNKIWGNSILTSGGTGAVTTGAVGNILSFENNEFDNNACAILIANNVTFSVLNNNKFGQLVANTEDIGVSQYIGLAQIVFQNNIGNTTLDLLARSFMTPFGYVRFSNFNSVANDNREYQRYGEIFATGTGLSDTTSHNGGFAMRFSSALSGDVQFSQKIPTGNIQNKDMMVGVWVNVSSANYWASTHTMPRLTVTYDGATVAYAEAGQVTGWQYIFVPFTPITTSGIIEVKFTSNTVATTTNSYVYFDDLSALYPAGHQLNLGNMDLWYEGAPVTPMIATNLSAQDVWAVDPTSFGADTVGDKVNKIKNDTGIIPALL